MGRSGLPAGLEQLHDASVPGYIFPESAARALGAMWRFRQRQREPEGKPVSFTVNDAAVSAILDGAPGGGKLPEPDALRILEAYGIPVVPWRYVPACGAADALARDAAAAARALGFPVALKVVSPDIIHKTDVGGVVLDLADEGKVVEAARRILKSAGAAAAAGPPAGLPARQSAGLLVQRMAPGGRETIVGLTRVPRVGALVMFGLGGVYVEVLRDVQFRLVPLLDVDARRMVRDVRMYGLLEGVRGEAPRDLAAIEEVLLRASQLAARHPRIAEMDVNPLFALERGVVAVDARFRVEASA
jgi:acetyltransferase